MLFLIRALNTILSFVVVNSMLIEMVFHAYNFQNRADVDEESDTLFYKELVKQSSSETVTIAKVSTILSHVVYFTQNGLSEYNVWEVRVAIKCVNHCFMFLQSILIALTVSLGRAYVRKLSSIFPLCIKSNALEKSTNNNVASIFFAHTPMIQRLVRNCEVVDRFLRKPF